MTERRAGVARVAALLADATTIGVVGHVGPDGDALGSMIALALAARSAGKSAVASFDEPFVVPSEMSYLDTSTLVPPSEFPRGLDLGVVVDTSVRHRVGSLAEVLESAKKLIVVDHHLVADPWGEGGIVDASAAATAELVYEIIEEAGWPMDADIATALYTGIVTDTGRFQYSSTTPTTHRIAASLLAQGVATDLVGQRLYEEAPFGFYDVIASVLGRAVLDSKLRLVWSAVYPDDLERAGLAYHEIDPLIDLVRMAKESDVACLLKVKEDGTVKGSLRSRGRVNVAEVAGAFGGGGHHNAAGFTATGTPEDIMDRIRDLLP